MTLNQGDVVWAKMKWYPIWPAVITEEASSGTFIKVNGSSGKIFVDFLGGKWTPCWISISDIKIFDLKTAGPNRSKEFRAARKWEKCGHLKAINAGLEIMALKGNREGTLLHQGANQVGEPQNHAAEAVVNNQQQVAIVAGDQQGQEDRQKQVNNVEEGGELGQQGENREGDRQHQVVNVETAEEQDRRVGEERVKIKMKVTFEMSTNQLIKLAKEVPSLAHLRTQ